MAPAQGPHGAQGTHRLGKATGPQARAQTKPIANKQSHFFLSLSQLIKITKQSF